MWKKQARSLEKISRCETWRSELIVVCFDTDFLITFMREDEKAVKEMEELIGKGLGPGCTTVINAMELYKGAFRSRDNQEVDGVKRLLGMFDMLALTHESAMLAGEIDANGFQRSQGAYAEVGTDRFTITETFAATGSQSAQAALAQKELVYVFLGHMQLVDISVPKNEYLVMVLKQVNYAVHVATKQRFCPVCAKHVSLHSALIIGVLYFYCLLQ
jgi:predicted nucleic acid-binding protein